MEESENTASNIGRMSYRNVVNRIDRIILDLGIVKASGSFPESLYQDLMRILIFIKEINLEEEENILHNERYFIEKRALKQIRENYLQRKIDAKDIEDIITNLKKRYSEKNVNSEKISNIQKALVRLSLPIWDVE